MVLVGVSPGVADGPVGGPRHRAFDELDEDRSVERLAKVVGTPAGVGAADDVRGLHRREEHHRHVVQIAAAAKLLATGHASVAAQVHVGNDQVRDRVLDAGGRLVHVAGLLALIAKSVHDASNLREHFRVIVNRQDMDLVGVSYMHRLAPLLLGHSFRAADQYVLVTTSRDRHNLPGRKSSCPRVYSTPGAGILHQP